MYKPNEDAKKLLAATNVKKERRYGGETTLNIQIKIYGGVCLQFTVECASYTAYFLSNCSRLPNKVASVSPPMLKCQYFFAFGMNS